MSVTKVSVTKESSQAAYHATIGENNLQTEFPIPDPPQPPAALPQWLVDILAIIGGDFGKIIIATAAVIIGGYLAYRFLPHLRRWLQKQHRRRDLSGSESIDFTMQAMQEAKSAHVSLEAADRLAQAGRYSEAVHLLLSRSIEDIASHRPTLVQPALTARDLSNADSIPSIARIAFAKIAYAVEISLFGGRRIDESIWHRCRADYAKLTIADNWR